RLLRFFFQAEDGILYRTVTGVQTCALPIYLDPLDVQKALAVTAYGAFLVAQQAARRMLPKKHGAILLTGASAGVKGYPQSAPFRSEERRVGKGWRPRRSPAHENKMSAGIST